MSAIANANAAIRRIGRDKAKEDKFIAGRIRDREIARHQTKMITIMYEMRNKLRVITKNPTGLFKNDEIDVLRKCINSPTASAAWFKFNQYIAGIQLKLLATDQQNVHTTIVVQKTNEVIKKILAIPVPFTHTWNDYFVCQTLGEILTHLQLTPENCGWFVEKYLKCSNRECSFMPETRGLYGKMIDGIWQFICNSPHKTDLMKILRDEIHDSVAMCADGCISRLCNVLSGYMDGLNFDTESPVEKAGRLLSQLVSSYDNNASEIMELAENILHACGIPQCDWEPWLETVRESK